MEVAMLAISFIIENWGGDGSTYILSLFCAGASRGKTHTLTILAANILCCKNLLNISDNEISYTTERGF